MHRLFWKIFFSFWVVLILFAGAIMIAASHYVDQIKGQRETSIRYATWARYVAEAQAALDHEGMDGLKSWAREVDGAEMVPVLVLGIAGRDVLGRDVPDRVLERLRRYTHPRNAGEQAISKIRTVIDHSTGRQFWLTHDFQSVTLSRFLERPRVIALPLIAGVLLGAMVCMALARYLTAPLERLRKAAVAYAGGQLTLRVGPSLGNRRDEIVDLAKAFDHMAERLNSLVSSQKQLLRDVSHELRSPLSRLQVASGLARQQCANRPSPELDRIDREVDRLNEMIGQLLSLARLESDTQPPAAEPVDLRELVETIAEDAALEARLRQCALEVKKVVPAVIRGNASLLHSAVENVVRNAVKYAADRSSIVLTLDRHPELSNWFIIQVRDHGPGVPEEMLFRLFEPFVRVGDARDRNSGGYGLGLAIAKRAVQLHGGQISARNEQEGGFIVTISLPEAVPACQGNDGTARVL